MKLLDERGIGTVWSICKEKFALVGHTHNYAGSGSPGGSANSAIGVVDYNQTGKTIQIGYSGTGITGDQIKYIAGYTVGSGNVNAKIKDVSKDALKSWLDLGSYVLKSSAVADVGSSLDVNSGTQTLKITKADGTVVYKGIIKASNEGDGIMSKEDKAKLDGIQSGANNYALPVASSTTLGGIKASSPYIGGYNFPICVDEDNKAYTRISGLDRGERGDRITQVSVSDDDDTNFSTKYTRDEITVYRNTEGEASLRFPSKSGTFALTSDIPTKTSQLANDSGFLKQGDFECTINIYLIDTQLTSDKFEGVNITIEQQGEDVRYAIWYGSPISFTADAKAKIKISVSHADGYITPNAVEFKTVIGRDEDITFTYTPAPLGVYICDTDNKLTLPDKWDSSNNYKAVGVYVGTENSWFVIAPTLSDSSNIVWSYTDNVIPGVATSINSEVAKKDYAGKTNTDKIIAELGTISRYAARYCRDYTFKNGKKGYLWSLGEALDAFNNKAAINQALDKIGGSYMPTNEYFWTSTQYNDYRAWKLSFLYGYEADDNKDSLCYVRAVCAI